MRRKLFDWHLSLGYAAAFLMIVWSVSGAAMIMDPIVRRAVEKKFPKLPVEGFRAADFAYPVSKLPVDGAAAVVLRRLEGRAWYEIRGPKGNVLAFDGRTGKPVPAEAPESDIRSAISRMLAGSKWTVASLSRITAADDHYRNGEYPSYRVYLAGQGGVELYVSARDATVLKTTTRWSRFFRWVGMGIHTWNLQAFKNKADDVRRWSLTLLVALPIGALAVISLVLLQLRKRALARAAAPPELAAPEGASGHARRHAATLTALCLVLASPGPAVAAGMARIVVNGAHAPIVPIGSISQPISGKGVILTTPNIKTDVGSALPVIPAPIIAATDSRPAVAIGVVAAARPVALAAPADGAQAKAPVAGHGFIPEIARDGGAETSAVKASIPFDKSAEGKRASESDPVLGGTSESVSSLGAHGGGPRDPKAAPPSPEGPGRKGLWGLYVTHGAHLLTMSAAWRVAWPLLALDLAGKAGLAFIGSTSALVEMGTGLVAGMLVDRFLPRKSMAAAAVARAAISLAIVGAVSMDAASMPFLFGAFLAHSFALTTIHIGQSTAAPVIAGSKPGELRRINSVLKIITAAVSIPGALAGGWLVASIGGPAALVLYAAANALVLAPLYAWLMPKAVTAAPVEQPQAPAPKSAEPTGLWAAAKIVFTNRILIGALIAMGAAVLLAEPLKSTTLPIIARDLAPATAAMLLGGFQASFYAGQFAGNLGLLKWGEKLSNRSWMLLGAAGLAAFWLFTLAPVHVGFALAGTALIGLLTQPLSVVGKTVFQEEVRRVKPELLGRAMGVNNLVYRLTVSAGIALVGWASISALLGATTILATVYTVVGALLVAAVAWLVRPAPAAASASGSGAMRKLAFGAVAVLALGGAAAALIAMPFSPLQWHMNLGMLAGPLAIWMAATGAVTILGPLLKKKFDPKLPDAPAAAGFSQFAMPLSEAERLLAAARPDFRPVSAAARQAAGRSWYEFQNAAGAYAAVDARDGRLIEPLITKQEAAEAARQWLAGSRWSVRGEPELLASYDEQYRKGDLPAYRVALEGPGSYDAYLSARDGRPVEALSRLSRVLRWAGIGMHTFGFGLLKSRYDSVRRVAMPLVIALPIILAVTFAMLSRLWS